MKIFVKMNSSIKLAQGNVVSFNKLKGCFCLNITCFFYIFVLNISITKISYTRANRITYLSNQNSSKLNLNIHTFKVTEFCNLFNLNRFFSKTCFIETFSKNINICNVHFS